MHKIHNYTELLEFYDSEEYKKDYIEFLGGLDLVYRRMLNNSRTLLDVLKHSNRMGVKVTVSTNLFANDLVKELTSSEKITFDKYLLIEPTQKATSKISLDIPKEHRVYKQSKNELEYLINKGGIDNVMTLLKCLNNMRVLSV